MLWAVLVSWRMCYFFFSGFKVFQQKVSLQLNWNIIFWYSQTKFLKNKIQFYLLKTDFSLNFLFCSDYNFGDIASQYY